MALALDANSRGNNSAAHTSLTWSHTCTGSELVLYVLTSVESDTGGHTAQTVSGITYNTVALTKITSKYVTGDTDNGCEIWRLIAPATGANNIVVTYTGEVDGSFGAGVSFTGADQTDPDEATGVGETTPAGASCSASLTTLTANDILLNILHATNSGTVLTKDANDTQLYNEATTGDHFNAVAYSSVTTATNYTRTWTASPNDVMAMAIVAIKPSTTVATMTNKSFMTTNTRFWGG